MTITKAWVVLVPYVDQRSADSFAREVWESTGVHPKVVHMRLPKEVGA